MQRDAAERVHRAHGSGRWFPAAGAALERQVRDAMARAEPARRPSGRIVAALAPHAGYVYSGPVAGYTFRALAEDAERHGPPEAVVVLGFSHAAGYRGTAFMPGRALATPLGEAVLDRDLADRLTAESDRVRLDYEPHAGEHSAENQVPFLQVALPGVPLAIGLLGDHGEETLSALAEALGKLAAVRRTLVVASTDLLHDPDYEHVSRTDAETLSRIAALDESGLAAAWSHGHQVCCGIGPVRCALRVASAQGCRRGEVLYYRNSGDDHPQSRGHWVVGYGAVVFPVD